MSGFLSKATRATQPKSPATVLLRSPAARHFYQALQWCGFVSDNPFETVMIQPDPVKPHEKCSEYGLGTVKDLVHACDTFDDPVSIVAILLAVLSGLRIDEIVKLQWKDVDFRKQLIRMRGKGNKTRLVPLDVAVGEVPHQGNHVLMRYYGRAWAPYQTAGLRARFKRLYLKAFGVDPFDLTPNGNKGVHAFRHTLGVIMQEQVGALETQALLGHESLSTTMRYSKVTSRKASERARKAQEALGRDLDQ